MRGIFQWTARHKRRRRTCLLWISIETRWIHQTQMNKSSPMKRRVLFCGGRVVFSISRCLLCLPLLIPPKVCFFMLPGAIRTGWIIRIVGTAVRFSSMSFLLSTTQTRSLFLYFWSHHSSKRNLSTRTNEDDRECNKIMWWCPPGAEFWYIHHTVLHFIKFADKFYHHHHTWTHILGTFSHSYSSIKCE